MAPDEARPRSVIIFDDVACEKLDHIRSYFCMGRYRLVDCFYLCQTYTRIQKHLVRDNANFLIIFKQDDMHLRHIYNDHVNIDMTYPQFKEMCMTCWPDHGFLVIDKDSEPGSGRYRKGFDQFIAPNSTDESRKRNRCRLCSRTGDHKFTLRTGSMLCCKAVCSDHRRTVCVGCDRGLGSKTTPCGIENDPCGVEMTPKVVYK